jgi:chorismate synthase
LKYGYTDLRPSLERASARETAARVAVGGICKQLLAQFGIQVGGYVVAIGSVVADLDKMPYTDRVIKAEASEVRCPDEAAAEAMTEAIRGIIQARDTLGGLIEVIGFGLPPGLGSHVQWDRKLEARLAAAVMSVQAIKGMEIGPAFENARLPGTAAQDSILLEGELLIRGSNRSGGLEGGVTTGQPLVIRAAMKPIATTLNPQQSVDLHTGNAVPTHYERSDFCPVPRAVPILEAMVAYVLAEALLEKLGGDSIGEMLPRFAALRQPRLTDALMDGEEHIFWPE